MDFTGVRWRLTGAEAILKPRTIRANGDWTDRLLAIPPHPTTATSTPIPLLHQCHPKGSGA